MASLSLAKPCVDHPSFKGHLLPNPTTERGNHFHLGVHPKQPSKVVYPSGKYIVVRDIDSGEGFVYRGHNTTATVAKFSPSGCWVASGDITGKVRVWAWDNPEHNLKIEIGAIAGAVKDLAWDPESKRIVAVGDGGTNMRAFTWDSGNNLGEMVGHVKRVLSCDYRPVRPFKVITASEDMRTIFFKGPPFTMEHSKKDLHTKFINVVRFSPDGSLIASAGSDSKVWIYDGATGEPRGELPTAHTGSIYGLAWSPDSTQLVTASADKTCILWNVPNSAVEHTWTFADTPEVGDMQCACAWVSNNRVVSVSLRGDISILTPGVERPTTVIVAHQVALTAMSPTLSVSGELLTASFDGVVCAWTGNTGSRLQAQGTGSIIGAAHTNKVSGIAVSSIGVVTVGWDDTLRIATDGVYSTGSVTLTSQPCGVSASPQYDLAAVAMTTAVALYRGTTLVAEVPVTYTPKSVALLRDTQIAVGGQDYKIYIYNVTGSTLTQAHVIEGHRGAVTCVAYSPDGANLASGDTAHEVNVWNTSTYTATVQGLWQFHATTINCVAWCPDSRLLATGGVDDSIYVWSLDKPRKRINYKFAHKDGVVGLCWESVDVLASAGGDHSIAKWGVAADKTAFA